MDAHMYVYMCVHVYVHAQIYTCTHYVRVCACKLHKPRRSHQSKVTVNPQVCILGCRYRWAEGW